MIINAVLIDDEKPSLNAIDNVLTKYCPSVKVLGKTTSATEGIQLVNKYNPDLVFLDIEMPEMNGFELLETFQNPNFQVIFITSYEHYAVQAFKVNAIDYILKPISIKDISQAINRVVDRKKSEKLSKNSYKSLFESLQQQNSKKIQIPTAEGVLCIDPDEVIRFSADGRYSTLHLINDKSICFTKTLKEIENFINHPTLFRIHRSHIINLNCVKKYNLSYANELELCDGTKISISRNKKDDFFSLMVDLSE